MMLVGEFLYCIVCMFVHRFSEGWWWGRVRRSVYLVVVSCLVFALCTCLGVYRYVFPLFDKAGNGFHSPCHYQSYIWDRRMVSHV